MPGKTTRVDRAARWLKNHPVSSPLIILGTVVIALGAVGTALRSIRLLFQREPHLEVADVRVIDQRSDIRDFQRTWLPAETTVVVWDSARYDVEETKTTSTDKGIVVSPTGRRHTQVQPIRGTLGSFPLIDIVLRNPSSFPAAVTSIDVLARRLTSGRPIGNCDPIVPTWAYHVLLWSDSSVQAVTAPVAQQVRPNGTDRFVLVLGHQGYIADAKYEVTLQLHYNKGATLSLGKHIISITSLCGAGPKLTTPLRPSRP